MYADRERPAFTSSRPRLLRATGPRPATSTSRRRRAPRCPSTTCSTSPTPPTSTRPILPPATAAGLPKSDSSDGAVGVYGEGLTQVIAIPLRDREADALRDQLEVTPGVEQTDGRTVVSVGPLSVVLTGEEGDGGFLLAGTLTRPAIVQAADDVLDGFVFTEDDR